MTKFANILAMQLYANKFAILFGVLSCSSLWSSFYVMAKDYNKNECISKPVNLDSIQIFPELNFKAKWTRDHKHFWKSTEFDFEARYLRENNKHGAKWQSYHFGSKNNSLIKGASSQVKVFLLPFSHNDPGWKQTYEAYFYTFTKKILTNAISKLSEHKNMTFAWSEVSFLSKWWDEASYVQKDTLKRLVKEGRFEILTGGWVMPDEATTTVFALVNQLIQGHQWIKRHLHILPVSAWSIDAFGHSSTLPYLYKQSGLTGMMIQRVHYAWKHWFAEHQEGDFIWLPRWSSNREKDGIHCHNAHYDLYPTKHSCGPNPNICMRFDFRRIESVREEHLAHVQEATLKNAQVLADSLTGQYRRTASLTKHNVVVASIGGDFRFDHATEWDQQYSNYKLLSDFINKRTKDYHTTVGFGTLSNYFKAVKKSNVTLSTFSGDFFPYAEVIFPFAPGYWTGYYGTRPFWKKLGRETEDELLKAEIIFTFAYNLLRQHNHSTEVLFRNYDNLVHARRSLALFQHHDGITGTSPRDTMLDFAKKLTQAWNFCRQIQRLSIENIWRKHLGIGIPPLETETRRKSYTTLAENVPLKLYENANIVKKVVIYNALAWKRSQLVRLLLKGENKWVTVRDPSGKTVTAQISALSGKKSHESTFELLFIAELPPLSVVTFEVGRGKDNPESKDNHNGVAIPSTISCKKCNGAYATVNQLKDSEIILENRKIKATFDGDLGLLRRIEGKGKSVETMAAGSSNVTISFGRYDGTYGSGAYLLHPFTSTAHQIIDSNNATIYLVKGPVISEIILITPHLTLKSWILHTGSSTEQMSVVHMSLHVNGSNTHSFGEHILRFQTDLNNTEATTMKPYKNSYNFTVPSNQQDNKPHPVLFTDANGFSVEKRVTLGNMPYHANHFPITHFAFIQDTKNNLRFTLLVDRSHGVSSVVKGRLETIFDRRLRYDDARGMEEGVNDLENAVSNYIIALERTPDKFFKDGGGDDSYNSWQPSLAVQKLSKCLNHQPTIFVYDGLSTHRNGNVSLFSQSFPDDVHLVNLHTLWGSDRSVDIKSVPSTKALMILQRLSHYNSYQNKNQPGSLLPRANYCNQQQFDIDNPLLGATMRIHHFAKRTNLVGTKEWSADATTTTTKNIRVGEPHELSAYFIHF